MGGVWLVETPGNSVHHQQQQQQRRQQKLRRPYMWIILGQSIPASPPPCDSERPPRLSCVAADSVSGAGLPALVLTPAFITITRPCVR